MQELTGSFIVILWAFCWMIGGLWLARAAFKLKPEEEGIIGLVVGLTAEVGLTNFIARVIPLDLASWISAMIILMAGFGLVFRQVGWGGLKVKIAAKQLLVFVLIFYIFFLISRGLAIYDDYAHLPTISIMATGEVPPRFPVNIEIPYGYHYFVLLFGAQIMRLAGNLPWTAWDIARAFTVAPAVILGGLWAYRLTRNKLAGVLGGAGVLFISGTRWLLLLLPSSILSKLSSQVQLIGSGADAGSTLVSSLSNPWPIDGQGSFPFPYAFENGLFSPGVEGYHIQIGLMKAVIFFTLLLTSSRWRNKWGALVSVILISSLGLLTEIELPMLGIAVFLLVLDWILRHRSFKIPSALTMWLVVWFFSAAIMTVQGGAGTDVIHNILLQLQGQTVPASYQKAGLELAAPSIVSGHLGVLSLLDPRSIFIVLVEFGPVLLVLPLLVAWSRKAARAGRWFDATLMIAAMISLAMIFVHFSGSVRETSRTYFFVHVCVWMAVPLVWLWTSHRKRIVQEVTTILGCVVFLGGIVILGVQMPNIKNQIFSFFITPYDVTMTEKYWDKLEPGSLVFDSVAVRGATIFGRYTVAGVSWYKYTEEFTELVANPDVHDLRQAGFSYIYIDQKYWLDLTAEQQSGFTQPCVVLLEEVQRPRNDKIWRKLYDIRGCP